MDVPEPADIVADPPRRLESILALVPGDAGVLVDVGYDHGAVLARWLRGGGARRAIGVERQAVCAPRFAAAYPDLLGRADLRVGEGLRPVRPGEGDVAVLAGLGERTVCACLREAPEVLASLDAVILCPADLRGVLRPALEALGWHPARERLAWERGRFYEIMALARGPDPCEDEAARLVAPRLIERDDPLLRPWLAWRMRGVAAALRAIRARGVADEAPAARFERDRWHFDRRVLAMATIAARLGL